DRGDQRPGDVEAHTCQNDRLAAKGIRSRSKEELAERRAEQEDRNDGLHLLDRRAEAALHGPERRQCDVTGERVEGEQQAREHYQKWARHAVASVPDVSLMSSDWSAHGRPPTARL